MSDVTAIILTRNEAAHIAECIGSTGGRFDVLVVDSGSSDDTRAIAAGLGAHVMENPWPGYGPQLNFALRHVTTPWTLILDADERLTPPLVDEIAAVTRRADVDGLRIGRDNYFLGKHIRHSGWGGDSVLRLFRTGKGGISDDVSHARTLLDGRIGHARHPMMHLSYTSIQQLTRKIARFSSNGAIMKRKQGKRGGLGAAIAHGTWAFLRCYVLQRGFLDGREGFIIAAYNAHVAYYKYLKLAYDRDIATATND